MWIAEQKADEEKKKLAELQKQIMEERQIQELRQLQVASGQSVKTTDTSMDWMYEGPAGHSMQQQQKATDEYLLGMICRAMKNSVLYLTIFTGKTYQAKEELQTDLHKLGSFSISIIF